MANAAANAGTSRRNVVLADPVAFGYLADELGLVVVERQAVLQGYELYLVEQWACSRRSPTLVIATYTGDPKHSINVGVLSIPAAEADCPRPLQHYFKAIQQYHARPKDTPLGELMVTNLSSFPSALTVIPVPDGDLKRHREVFIVNENLKRLGCSGRSGLTLSEPSPATQAKFLQLYKTSDRIPFFQSVIELLKLCQAALFLFGKLEHEFIDGLLCDMTETAISNWWIEIGSEYFNVEPSDGILGPTTVAALIGTLMGARNRLHWWGAAVGKDAFEIDHTKRGIYQFQKAHKLERTRRLDRQTLLKLHIITAKAAAGEGGWGVQKAVKSTVAEIGGKRGEIVMGFVGGRDKGNIADVETLDMDKFISLVYGERAKWLWHGKPKRSASDNPHLQLSDAMGSIAFGHGGTGKEGIPSASPQQHQQQQQQSQQNQNKRSHTSPVNEEPTMRTKEESSTIDTTQSAPLLSPPNNQLAAESPPGDRDALRKTVFKRVGGKVNDARSGIGRTIRDAVGGSRRSYHQSRQSRDEHSTVDADLTSPSIASLTQSATSLSSPMVNRTFTWKNKPEEYLNVRKDVDTVPDSTEEARKQSEEHVEHENAPLSDIDGHVDARIVNGSSAAESIDVESDVGLDQKLAIFRKQESPPSWLQRRHSLCIPFDDRPLNNARWPRRMSFSIATDAALWWERLVDPFETEPAAMSMGNDGAEDEDHSKTQTLAPGPGHAELARATHEKLAEVKRTVLPWTQESMGEVLALELELERQTDDWNRRLAEYHEKFEAARHQSKELLSHEREQLVEMLREVEGLAQRLDYEINALASKVADVEDGVDEFEEQVEMVESKAEELKSQLETESWAHWAVRTVTGIGTGPNITGGSRQKPQRAIGRAAVSG